MQLICYRMDIKDIVQSVDFDLWKGEADAQAYIPDMVEMLKEKGFAHYDEGALVVDVAEETDKKEIPPCMILKSDGAALYDTTDLATLVEREKLYDPGIPLCEEDRNCKTGDRTYIPWIWYNERKRW